MSSTFLIFLALCILIQPAWNYVNVCQYIKCPRTLCKDNEVLVQKIDPSGCCDLCIPSDNNNNECPADICPRVRCPSIKACPKGTVLVPRGGFCGCCDACVPGSKECPPGFCASVSCLRVHPCSCKKNEVFVPNGSKCGCCSGCMPRTACEISQQLIFV